MTKFIAIVYALEKPKFSLGNVQIIDLSDPEEEDIKKMETWDDADECVKSILTYFGEYDESGNPTSYRFIKTVDIMEVVESKTYAAFLMMKQRWKEFDANRRDEYEKQEYERLKAKYEGDEDDGE